MTPLFLTTPELLDEWWDRAAVHLVPVVNEAARGEFDIFDLYRLCSAKRAVVAIACDGEAVVLAMVFEFIYYPRLTACNVMALGGSHLSEVAQAFFVTFKDWLHSMGVTVIEASCSLAMSRFLGRIGFERTYEVVRLKI